MATLKLSMDTRYQKGTDTFPVVIRISHQQRTTSLSTGVKVTEKHWDRQKLRIRKSHPNHDGINRKLRAKLNSVEKKVLKFEEGRPNFTIKELMNHLKNRQPNSDLFKFGSMVVKTLERSGKYGTAASYKSTLSRLKLGSQNGSIDLGDRL